MTSVPKRFGFFDEGDGEAVVLLHSSLSSRRQWRKLQQQLRGRYRLLGLDLLGYGETPMPAGRGGFRFAREVDLVERLLERVDGPAHLAGHSYGGAVALKTALRRPERVRSIYAHEPVLFALLRSEGWRQEWSEIAAVSLHAASRVREGRPDLAARGFINYWSGGGTWRSLSADRRQAFARTIPKVTLDFEAISSDTDGLSEYRKIEAPVKLTAGDTGAQTARRVAELLARALPNVSLQIVAGAGHMAPVTDAERINAIISEHLDAVSLRKRG
jgi:pimeloyl-ACP methyl ester carboxylesterase